MNSVKDLQRSAMEAADFAILAQRQGDDARAMEFFRSAYALESNAAHLANQRPNSEPTRSVLFRSAAPLALDCGLIREAERLICEALAGDPPEVIADELRDLMDDVRQKHKMSQSLAI